MCMDPATMMLISAGISAGTSVMQGYAQKQQSDYQAKVARNNAEIATRKARDAERQGQHERDRLRLQYGRDRARGELAYAGGNVALGAGSALTWQEMMDQSEAIDVALSVENADKRAQGFIDQRQNFLAEANALKASGRNAMIGGVMNAGATILGGASKSAMYKKLNPTTPQSIKAANNAWFKKNPFIGPQPATGPQPWSGVPFIGV